MTRIAVVGGGAGATVHAEAARLVAGVSLVGVGGRTPGTAAPLADAVGAPDLPLAALVERADALVVAVPPAAVAPVLALVPDDRVVLVESPTGTDGDPAIERPSAMTAANLLHAPTVKRALAAIGELAALDHLTLRVEVPSHHLDPLTRAAGVLPVLLAAAAEPAVEVRAAPRDTAGASRIELTIRLASGREVTATVGTTTDAARADLEAASPARVVAVDLWPSPSLDIDGRAVADDAGTAPLVALGFVAQIQRLAAVAGGRAAPWPPIAVGDGVRRLLAAATVSARTGGFCHVE